MPINLTTPTVVPSITYNEVWLSNLQVMAGNPNKPVRVVAQIHEAATVDGKKVLRPDSVKTVDLKDFFAAATPAELQIMGGLIMAIQARAGL